MAMKNPPHPGLSVRHDCIDDLNLTITEAAEILGVTRQTLNNLVNGKSGISPEMAVRLSKAFGLVASSKARPPGRRRLLYVLIIIVDQSQDNSTSCDARSQDWWANPSDPRLPAGMPDLEIAVAQPALYALDSRSRPSSTRRHYILL